MIHGKTQKKVIKVIQGLKAGKSLSQALKSAKILRGHYYSARDSMLLNGNPFIKKFVQNYEGVGLPPKRTINKALRVAAK